MTAQLTESGGDILLIEENQTLYGIDARYILEIMAVPCVLPLPGQNGAIRGVFNYKSAIVSLVSFGALCGLSDMDEDMCVVLSLGDEAVALSVSDVVDVTRRGADMAQNAVSGQVVALTGEGRDEQPVFLLDLRQMLDSVREQGENGESATR